MLTKTDLLQRLDSASRGIRPFQVAHPEYEQGCEYGLLVKADDGKLYLADSHNPITINPRMILVASLPVEKILSMCRDAVTAKFKSLSDDYCACCEKGDHIEWSSDAFETINEFLSLPETTEKV